MTTEARDKLVEAMARAMIQRSSRRRWRRFVRAALAKELAPVAGVARIEDRAATIEARKPWEALGMSRRTWYRRQKEKRDG